MSALRTRRRLHRIEPTAVVGVMSRDATVFTRNWKTTTFSSIVEPTIYLLAFGFGFGALISSIGGLDYKQYVGTGIVATAVLFSSAFPGMYGTFLKYRFQRTYDAFLAAPVDVDEIVSAEVLWIGLRAGVYGNVPLLVAIAFGLDPRPTAVLVPVICFVTGCAFVAFGVTLAATAESIDNFSYVTSGVLTPMFLTAGTFFPISSFPAGIEAVARLNPLYHCVQLVRDVVVLGVEPLPDLGHLAFLVAFGLGLWRLAIWRLRKRLID
ncbi:MAG TPA: ABC transporter permease [Conexibacter sp.]|nr:ABC transporter permease [Conexibacter sp.]